MPESESMGRPIGYWLRLVDGLLTARVDAAQRQHGMTRLEWQILNLLREGVAPSTARVAEIMRPFAAPEAVDAMLASLTAREWVECRADDSCDLTEAGAEVLALAQQAQAGVRARLMTNVTPDEYQLVVAVLQRIATNLQEPDRA